jgi:hypothetical protein
MQIVDAMPCKAFRLHANGRMKSRFNLDSDVGIPRRKYLNVRRR